MAAVCAAAPSKKQKTMAKKYTLEPIEDGKLSDHFTEQEISALYYALHSWKDRGYTFRCKNDGEIYTILLNNCHYLKLERHSDKKILETRVLINNKKNHSTYSTDDVCQLINDFNARFMKNMIAEEDMKSKKLAAQYGDSEPIDYDKIREMINDSVNSSIPVIVEKVITQLQTKQPTASTTPGNATPESAAPANATPGNETPEYEYEELTWWERLREFFK